MKVLQQAPTWAPLVAEALGVPALVLPVSECLSSIAGATADFRDEYYGLADFVRDQEEADEVWFPRLVVSGHIEPAQCLWGQRTIKFIKKKWSFPRIDLAALQAAPRYEGKDLAAWARNRLVPKILVATQTRTLEAVADPQGCWLTTTPTITVTPLPDAFWKTAAVLLSPIATVWALHHYGAGALTADAIKLSASQVLKIPLPAHHELWEQAAQKVEQAHQLQEAGIQPCLDEASSLMLKAYGIENSQSIWAWWQSRRTAR